MPRGAEQDCMASICVYNSEEYMDLVIDSVFGLD